MLMDEKPFKIFTAIHIVLILVRSEGMLFN